jgi:hypothetical protein
MVVVAGVGADKPVICVGPDIDGPRDLGSG